MERKETFESIKLLEPMVNITDDIGRTMRTDSSVAWKLPHAVVFGKLEADVPDLMCGKLSHSWDEMS